MITDNKYIDLAYTISYMHLFKDKSKNQIKAMLHFAELYHENELKKEKEQGIKLTIRGFDAIYKDYTQK